MSRGPATPMRRMRRRLSDESGYVLMTAVILMTVMMGVGLALSKWVDTQQRESGKIRTREAAFNLSESALTSQVQALARDGVWPTTSAQQAPVCTGASLSTACPTGAAMASLLASPDTSGGVTWSTEVRDNTSGLYYSDADAPVRYDANGDGKLWVRSQVTARGRTRTLVTMVQRQTVAETFPHAAVLAGRLDLANNGNKIIIDGTGAASGSLVVAVRCDPVAGETVACLGHAIGQGNVKDAAALEDMLDQQISPNSTTRYDGGDAIDDAARARLRATAIANGTWFATCPPSLPSGAVVWIDSGDCSYSANATLNSPENPGLLVIERGTLSVSGTLNFYGVIYMANRQGSSGVVVDWSGNGVVYGGILIDGQGILKAGQSGVNVRLVENSFNSIASYGSAGLVQSTWREIQP